MLVPAGEGRAFEARAGQFITIANPHGQQVADFMAFNADDLTEAVAANNTIVHLGSIVLGLGDEIVSTRRRSMLEVVHDDCGHHDLVVAPCDSARYEIYYGVSDHRNCLDNFVEALAPWNLGPADLPQTINIFQNMGYSDDGAIEFRESAAKPGDRIVLEAKMNLVAAVSACPMDLNPISGYEVTDLEIEVSDSFDRR